MEKLAINGGKPVRTKPFPAQYIGANLIGKEEKELVDKVIDAKSLFRFYGSNCLNMTEQFEDELKELLDVRYTLATSSGTGALFCGMKGLNIGKGDEVILPAFGWLSDYSAIALSGATPVFADIDESMNISPGDFKTKITARTKAVIVIHYQGAASRVDEIIEIARRRKIKVIEDVAQAIGGEYDGKPLGSFGDFSIFSFQNNKVITTGDGGAFATNDQEIFERAVRFHDLGMIRPCFLKKLEKEAITEPFPGIQWRMNELTGAVALAQLRKLPSIIKATKEKSSKLKTQLAKELPGLKYRDVKSENDIGILVSIDLGSKEAVDKFKAAYQAEGLVFGPTSGCGVMGAFVAINKDLNCKKAYREKDFETTRKIADKMAPIAILPVYDDNDIRDMAKGVIKVLKGIS